MSEDTRTLKDLANEALYVQDACNLSGVVLAWGRAIVRLRAILDTGTMEINEHPINQLWADKVAHLTGTQSFSNDNVSKAYNAVYKLSEQKE